MFGRSSLRTANEKQLSVICDETEATVDFRDGSLLLRPVVVDALDVSRMFSKKEALEFPDRENPPILNVHAISLVLWRLVSRGHMTMAVLPGNFQMYVPCCTDQTALQKLVDLELLLFDDKASSSRMMDYHMTIASCAFRSNGCLVGSRGSYYPLAHHQRQLTDFVAERFVRPLFTADGMEAHFGDTHKGCNPFIVMPDQADFIGVMDYQLSAEDQLYLMIHMCDVIRSEKSKRMCTQMRESRIQPSSWPTTNGLSMQFATVKLSNQKKRNFEEENVPTSNNDEGPPLPEYARFYPQTKVPVAEPSSTTIGFPNSIYRFGNDLLDLQTEISPLRMTYVDALSEIFGRETAWDLVLKNPDCRNINQMLEIGMSELRPEPPNLESSTTESSVLDDVLLIDF
ncbi:unnamed protein product [Caenorhabditis auriculariae]|uniref:RNase NYN domain-containing protein n=1 Tax=Caenorhabditis auriculariae TaxID=2777116 RepID=A0A8S1HBA6_9PELO|nr:unnamed protein product [Caenorhabditis auriculariae]